MEAMVVYTWSWYRWTCVYFFLCILCWCWWWVLLEKTLVLLWLLAFSIVLWWRDANVLYFRKRIITTHSTTQHCLLHISQFGVGKATGVSLKENTLQTRPALGEIEEINWEHKGRPSVLCGKTMFVMKWY